MKRNFENRLDRLEQARGNIMQPGQLPEKQLIACFDPEVDKDGNELPVIEMGGLFRMAGEIEDDFFDRVLKNACVGQPVGFIPVLIAHRQAPVEADNESC